MNDNLSSSYQILFNIYIFLRDKDKHCSELLISLQNPTICFENINNQFLKMGFNT